MSKAQKHTPLPFLGLACAVGVSSIYYNQPLLVEMGHTFGATSGATGYVAVATQVGYALGMLAFVPMGDLKERRGLMLRMYAAVSIALLLTAAAQSLPWLIAASALVGLLASVTHIVLPIAPDLASDEERGRAIGTVMTGLLLGVLLARTFSGWVSRIHFGAAAGWRTVFVVAAVINLSFVPMLRRTMPALPPKHKLSYGEAIRSLWTLWSSQRLLRESAAMGALIFASFSCFWTTLAFFLGTRYGLGAGVAGTFGVVGAAGAVVAPLAGRMADRHGPRYVLSWALVTLAASFVWLWVQDRLHMPMAAHVGAMVVGVIVLDMGAQMSQIANQTRIFGLDASARSRLNTVYMTVYFTGAAVGSALVTFAWVHWQWNGVCILALALLSVAALVHATGKKGPCSMDHIPVEEERVLEV
ncbi:MFS transporter [Terriglobus albidus]|uniref:MFS transporter n=1 Tax=Terriglobus albidus TaxID=1592106 RepID=A0A5B9EGL6_9BACT|nr:MFS transporter [Terriglobus albidus]QEE30959.1 MFS transporter [Terriglobus albidus]